MGKPIYLRIEKTISQRIEVVWETIAVGFGNVAAYNPAIKSSRLESGQLSGVGTIRHCDFVKSGYIKEQITEWQDHESFKLKMILSSVPLAMLESKFTLQKEDHKTLVIQEFWYRLRAPLGWMSQVMKLKMRKTLEQGLSGLKNYLTN